MLAGGSAQALDHICTLFTKPGDAVLVEAPTYHETLQLFRDHKLRPRQVAMGKDGLRVDLLAQGLEALARSGERVRFLYTIPNFQNPSGLTLAAHCRREILELAERYDFLVLEDDVYRELCYDAEVPPSLFALARQIAGPHDSGRRVLRIGSFSKILAPGVRLGWILGPPQLIDGLINSGLRRMGGGANPLMANILATYCQQGSLDSHINLLRRVYLERRDAMLAALKAHMPCDVTWTRPGGGFFVWLTLPTPLRATHVAARAKKAKLLVLAGDPFFAETPTGEHLRLAFSYVTPDEIKEGVGWLAQALEEGA
jgi:DNA-binding transcriptional MocR family regulator